MVVPGELLVATKMGRPSVDPLSIFLLNVATGAPKKKLALQV
jgi:hypothetical protein